LALYNSVYTGGFSSYLSSNTLRNSPKHWSFSKADRFQMMGVDSAAKYNNFPTVFSTKCCTQGFGDRPFMSNLPCAHSPPPTQYRIISNFEKKEALKGKSFGVSRHYYDNVYIPGNELVTPLISSQVPGPGQYATATTNPIGKNAKKFSLKSRVPPCTSSTREYPAPNMYRPAHALVEATRYNGVGFGIGGRGNPTGPGSINNISLSHNRLDDYTWARHL